MDQTPRPRPGAFPQTPANTRRPRQYDGSPQNVRRSGQPIPEISTIKPSSTTQSPSDPLIPEHILDAPTQRLFVVSFAVALWTWRLYDWGMLNESEEQSLWLFMKWVAIDGIFLFGMPGLRIPWLEWSSFTMMSLFFFHAFTDAMLMFRIPIPLGAGLLAVWRSIYGAYETAINENNVNPEAIRFNDSLILGRQVIHILPEGSAILNPEKHAYCIDHSRAEARLPIMINSTNPISMDILRTDLETQANETIHISKAQIKTMHKEASRLLSYSDKPNEPKTLYYAVKKPGLYVLSKVVDESNLEVARKRLAHTVVVPCPKAVVVSKGSDRCRGELSNVEIEVTGTPPLTLKYRKVVDQTSQDATFENILPDDFISPLARQRQDALTVPNKVDTFWARPQRVVVPLSESLDRAGRIVYSIEEVRDGFGNNVSFTSRNHGDQERHVTRSPHLHQVLTVHERPTINLKGCTPQHPLKAAKGQKRDLPIVYGSTGRGALANTPYHLEYSFSPEDAVSAAGEHEAATKPLRVSKKPGELPSIIQPGLYTLTGVSTEFCSGEVLEPASCVLQNPPQPQLSIASTPMYDECAKRPVGLKVDLALVGTPPFKVQYRMTRAGYRIQGNYNKTVSDSHRGLIELTPSQEGHYTYDFVGISDAVYQDQPLKGLSLEQDVRPSVSAGFASPGESRSSCIDDTVSMEVLLQGEGPFAIEYELVHGGKREKHKLANLEHDRIELTTEPLTEGGDYTLALTSVTDRMDCQVALQEEAGISVQHQKPRVGFKSIEGQRSISTVEKKEVELPLRLEGEPPFTIRYLDSDGKERSIRVKDRNDRIFVNAEGLYELTSVRDASCPGNVDLLAKDFEVAWIPRPELRIPRTDIIEERGTTLVRKDVCEGEDDAIEVLFRGSPSFTAHYVQHIKPEKGTMAPKNKEIKAATNIAPLRMDTHQAGEYEYRFQKLEDANYKHDSKHFTPVTIKQRVNSRPSAAFVSPGKKYSFCSVESDGEEVIPITLYGAPPFDLEVEIKHHGSVRPELVTIPGIGSNSYNIRIPHRQLHLGNSAVHLRRVSDSRGCVRILDLDSRVQISVHNAPTITALESQTDFCVGEPINFGLSGAAPFNVFYTFEGAARKAVATSTTFRRLAEKPGTFVITGVQDAASQCKSTTNITKRIHGMPSVRVSKGKDAYVDIHEGGFTDIQFDFGGTPPFEFTYTRSSNTQKHGRKAGEVLSVHSERSEEYMMRVRAHEEGTYEVISIKDQYCSYAKPGVKVNQKEAQKRLQY